MSVGRLATVLVAALFRSSCGVADERSTGAPDAEVGDAQATADQSTGSPDTADPHGGARTRNDAAAQADSNPTADDAETSDASVTHPSCSVEGAPARLDAGNAAASDLIDSTLADKRSLTDGQSVLVPLAPSCAAIGVDGSVYDAVVDATIGVTAGLPLNCGPGLLHQLIIRQLLCGSVVSDAVIDYGYFPESGDPVQGERLVLGLVTRRCPPEWPSRATPAVFIAGPSANGRACWGGWVSMLRCCELRRWRGGEHA